MTNFLNPSAFAWLLLALPIIALYLVVLGRRRQQTVSAMLLWERTLARRSTYSGLQRWLSLAAALMLLVLIVLALAEPYLGDSVRQRRVVILVVDRSASMTADDGRFEQAIATAQDLLDQLGPGDAAGLISFGERLQLHSPPTENLDEVRHALNQLQPAERANQTGAAAVELARLLVADHPAARIASITDAAWDGAGTLADDPIAIYRVGSSLDNVAVTQFEVREGLQDQDDFALIGLRNFSNELFEGELELTPAAVTRPIRIPPGDEAILLVPLSLNEVPQDQPMQAIVTSEDGFVADNALTTSGRFIATTDSRPGKHHRRIGEADLRPRDEASAAPPWPARGRIPTWLWPALLAAGLFLLIIEFALFQRRVFV